MDCEDDEIIIDIEEDEDYDGNKTNKKNTKMKTKDKKRIKKSKSLGKDKSKTALNDEFIEYFDAFRIKDEFMISENDTVNKESFDVKSYNEIIDEITDSADYTKSNSKLKRNNKNISLLSSFYKSQLKLDSSEKLNKISQYNLYDLIIELLTNNSNIFLYGFGSKLNLIYSFIEYFQENINGKTEYGNYHILIFNCFNPENSLKEILNEIQRYVIHLFESLYDYKGISEGLRKHRTIEEHIQTINTLIQQLELKGFNDKFLIILNNIEGPNFMNRISQGYLSNVANLNGVNVIATCDNVNLVYLWNQMIKDNFAFYYLKFHTFAPYDVEVSDINSLCGEKSLKSGSGLFEILASLSKAQKAIIKTLAELQLNEDFDKMTIKGLVDYFIDSGSGICTNQNKLLELISEAKDHKIIIEKKSIKNNKDVLRLNLDKEIIQRIVNGEYDI